MKDLETEALLTPRKLYVLTINPPNASGVSMHAVPLCLKLWASESEHQQTSGQQGVPKHI